MCALSEATAGLADQTSAQPDVPEVICSEENHIGSGREAGASAFAVAEAQPTDKNTITAAVHHAPTIRRVTPRLFPVRFAAVLTVTSWDFPRTVRLRLFHRF